MPNIPFRLTTIQPLTTILDKQSALYEVMQGLKNTEYFNWRMAIIVIAATIISLVIKESKSQMVKFTHNYKRP